jgi:hypothetical protein
MRPTSSSQICQPDKQAHNANDSGDESYPIIGGNMPVEINRIHRFLNDLAG